MSVGGQSLSVASVRTERLDPFRLKGPNFNVGPASGVVVMPMLPMYSPTACMKAGIMAAKGPPPTPDDAAIPDDGGGTIEWVMEGVGHKAKV